MPISPPSLCTNQCGALVYGGGRCADCLTQARHDSDKRRPNGYRRGWSTRWAAFSRAYLHAHPLCESAQCSALPQWRRPPSTDVDHTGGHSRTCAHRYEEEHLQALCHPCHSRKTATEDGGFIGATTRCMG